MLTSKIDNDLHQAMKSGDTVCRDSLRLVKTAIKNEEIAVRRHLLTNAEAEIIIARLVKQINETATEYRKLGDTKRALAEEAQAKVLKEYLPEQLSDENLTQIIETIIKKLGATSVKEMGVVIKSVKDKIGTRANGSKIAELVRLRLVNK